jgi:hypothetical protein
MSTDSEREIRGRLGAALDTITPAPAPVDAVIHRGRTLRRRRIGVTAGLAAVVGLGIALPGLAGGVHAAPPLQHGYRITVNRPRSTPSTLTFSGTVDGRPWHFALDWDSGQPMETGPGLAWSSMGDMQPDGQPANFSVTSSGTLNAMAGQVRSDVAYLALIQPDGSATYLRPVRWHGARWTGLEFRAGFRIRRIVVYSGHGEEVAYAVSFGSAEFNAWLHPGQRGLPRQTARIATGTLYGQKWSYYGYAGPWGICFRAFGGDGECLGGLGSRIRPGHAAVWEGCGGGGGQFSSGQAAPDVSYLEFRLSDGSTQRVVPVGLAGYRFFGFAIDTNLRVTGWTAYGSSGQVLGTGKSWDMC